MGSQVYYSWNNCRNNKYIYRFMTVIRQFDNNIFSSGMKTTSSLKIENKELQKKSEVVTDITHASQRSYKMDSSPVIKHLNLEIFKLYPCPNSKPHNHKHCINYHNAKDRKRFGENYSQNLCEFIQKGQRCPKGDNCLDAHSRVQQLYQYQTYKKKFCSHYPNNVEKCEYGDYCSFAHNQEQILVELIHNYVFDEDFYMFSYKTVFCPFNLTQHDKALCVYAHNWQDYRRNPNHFYYEPIACYNWKLKDYIIEYSLGCQNEGTCTMCHGWKQYQYHPSVYRTNKCTEIKCKKGQCPNYHSQNEKRVIPNEIFQKAFKIIPKNKIVHGVFKNDSTKQGFVPKPGFKGCQSMIEKTPKVQNQTKVKTAILSNVTEKKSVNSKGWIKDDSPIDSQDQDPQAFNLENSVNKLLLDQ